MFGNGYPMHPADKNDTRDSKISDLSVRDRRLSRACGLSVMSQSISSPRGQLGVSERPHSEQRRWSGLVAPLVARGWVRHIHYLPPQVLINSISGRGCRPHSAVDSEGMTALGQKQASDAEAEPTSVYGWLPGSPERPRRAPSDPSSDFLNRSRAT
jgi:hypothetical protein